MPNKRDRIFAAVIEHIKKDGLLTNIRVAEIAKDAGVGKGTVYEYFSSKEHIIAETIIYMLESTSKKILLDNYDALDFEQTLRMHIKNVTKLLLDNLSFHSLLMSQNIKGLISKDLQSKITRKIMGLKYDYHNYLQLIFDKGIKEGKIKAFDDLFIIVAVSNTIVTSIVYYIQEEHQIISLDEFINKLYRLIVKMTA